MPATVLERIEKLKGGPLYKKPYLQPTDESLRVMSYNILAPSLVDHVDYGNTKLEHINWETRYPQIQREIVWA
jgi:mRNA deadenylase 3'-5' endonuclease subunit Ccr4